MKLQLSLDDARIQAEKLITALEPACARIAVAGSIRRQSKYVGDIEIVAIPHYCDNCDLFGYVVGHDSLLDLALDKLVASKRLEPGDKQGPRYKKFILSHLGLQVDLFIPNLDRWGISYIQRTGSANFSRWFVTSQLHGGALPIDMRVKDGRLWRAGQALDTPQERDVFDAIGLSWLTPPQRTEGLWGKRGT